MTAPVQGGPADPIISQDYCTICDSVLAQGTANMDLIQRCKRCGLDVSEAEARQKQYLDMAASFKREFFPHNS